MLCNPRLWRFCVCVCMFVCVCVCMCVCACGPAQVSMEGRATCQFHSWLSGCLPLAETVWHSASQHHSTGPRLNTYTHIHTNADTHTLQLSFCDDVFTWNLLCLGKPHLMGLRPREPWSYSWSENGRKKPNQICVSQCKCEHDRTDCLAIEWPPSSCREKERGRERKREWERERDRKKGTCYEENSDFNRDAFITMDADLYYKQQLS